MWQSVAPLVVSNTLAAIVLECSTNASPSPTTEHYGHLMPLHLILELKRWKAVPYAPAKPRPLNGFQRSVNRQGVGRRHRGPASGDPRYVATPRRRAPLGLEILYRTWRFDVEGIAALATNASLITSP